MTQPYSEKRKKAGEREREKAAAGQDIGKIPPPKNKRRREKCRRSLREFCEKYLAGRFPLAWSGDHLRAIEKLEASVTKGGQFALAMPRGSGKTTLVEAAAIFAILYAHRSFVVLIGATEAAAEELLDSIKVELETNPLLLADFPESCVPIVALEGEARRCSGQRVGEVRTRIGWGAREVVMPTVTGSAVSGAVVRVAGITGRIRGMKSTTADGKSIRPDLVIIDDPQTDESAVSPTQNAYREKVLVGAVLGLAGPKKKISAVMPCTVIAPGDMADRILDRDRHPEWNGERTKMLPKLPANEQLWEEYARLRGDGMRAGDGGRAATEFYRANRKAMDEGAVAAWPERFNPDEISAVQHAMNIRIDNPRAFAAEYQNEPEIDKLSGELEELTPEQVIAKLNNIPRRVVPRECSRLTCGIDVQQKILFYTVTAWDEKFGGSIVECGTFPAQNRSYFSKDDARPSLADVFTGMSEEAAIYAGLKAVTADVLGRVFTQHETGAELRVEKCLIDSGWNTDTVYQFCRQAQHASVILPSKGRGIKAGDRPMSEWKKNPGDRLGWNWRMDSPSGANRGRHVLYDTNSWKSFVGERLRSSPASAGCVFVNGQKPHEIQLLADHLTSEYRVLTHGRGRDVEEWRVRPEKPENHWFDCFVMSGVAASVLGLVWSAAGAAGEGPGVPKPKRKKIDIEKLYAEQQAKRGAA